MSQPNTCDTCDAQYSVDVGHACTPERLKELLEEALAKNDELIDDAERLDWLDENPLGYGPEDGKDPGTLRVVRLRLLEEDFEDVRDAIDALREVTS